MLRLWWSQRAVLVAALFLGPSLLMMIPSDSSKRFYAEGFLSFKSTITTQQLKSEVERVPCLRHWTSLKCAGPLHESGISKSRNTKLAAKESTDPGVPTLTPSQAPKGSKSSTKRLAVVVAGGVGATLLVFVAVAVVFFCLMRARRLARRTSETGSSEQSPYVEMSRGKGTKFTDPSSHEASGVRQLSIKELEHATSRFSPNNIIGEGRFGLVYKGLLEDGTIVAIKQRLHDPYQSFFQEVKNMSHIQHRHIVKLIGFCEDNHQQYLVLEYMPKGNVGSHLYDADGLPSGKLELRQRLSIALGAAKGLEFLHGLSTPIFHMHFRTSNVLLDENFTAKVADLGHSRLTAGNGAGPSSTIDCFLDPEMSMNMINGASEKCDVYAFGVFLLELISGQEAISKTMSESGMNLVEEAKRCCNICSFMDKLLREKAVHVIQPMMEIALQCIDTGARRPTMSWVARELELIQERKMSHHNSPSGLGNETAVVTLGSDLFK